MADMILTSPVFADGEMIPVQYTCDGEGTIPPLSFANMPVGTQSLVLVMDDPDIPQEVKEGAGIDVFDHWVVFNMPADADGVTEGQEPAGMLGENSAGENGYTGPCPPAEYAPTTHRYVFRLYALDVELDSEAGATKAEIERAMNEHVLARATLTGRYQKQ